ncbi:hypothetical protein NMY22_g19717 [Coprinellus aureogranulatus]|nr:hypothetical protein NMY22_g19717 [Coprinellus aureogranulatus]
MADFVQEEEPSTPAAPAVAQASTDLSPLLAMLTKMQQGQDLLLQKVSRLETEVADLKQSAFVVQPSIPPITRTPSPGLEYVDREPEVPIPSIYLINIFSARTRKPCTSSTAPCHISLIERCLDVIVADMIPSCDASKPSMSRGSHMARRCSQQVLGVPVDHVTIL